MDIQKIHEYKSAFDLIAKNIKDDEGNAIEVWLTIFVSSRKWSSCIYKLSPFVGTFMPEEHRNNSGAYQGAKYFSYNGKELDEIRKEKELF